MNDATTTKTPAPRRIEWAGPEGWTIWADEDGCHLRSSHGDCLEMPDVAALFSLWSHARAAADADHIPAPQAPSAEEIRAESARLTEEYTKRRVIRAVEAEFDTPAPF